MPDANVIALKPLADPTHRLGRVELGCFRLEEVIGRGSYGTTFLATQLGFDRQAVVKIAHPELLDTRDAEVVRRRFADELRAATRVTHENLVTLYTAGETAEGLPAIAMELVPGDPLEDLLIVHPSGLPHEIVEPAFSQLASALAALHTAGVVHRDLSPRNVMLDAPPGQAPRLKVLDFGVAMLRGRPRHTLGAVGTPRYMAPEQVIGRAVPASDVFAMGAMLWWALTGQEYRSDTLTLEDLQRHELEGRGRVDPRTVAPDLPAGVARLVSDMLAHSEHERPTAEEFLVAWSQVASELRSRPPRRATRPSLPPPPPTTPRMGKPAPAPPVGTRPRPQPARRTPPPPPPVVGPGSRPRPAARSPIPPALEADAPQPRQHVDSVSDPPTYDSLPVSMADPQARPTAGPRVLVVDANAITQHLLIGCLRRNGCRVHGTRDPRDATRSAGDDYDLVVLSAEIPDADPLDIAQYLQEYHPEQWVVLAGSGTLDADTRAAGIREIVPVPSGFERLGEIIDLLRGELALRDSARPSDPEAVDRAALDALRDDDPIVVQETIELFLGQTPETLARIAEGHERRDPKAVRDDCRTLSTSARVLGANHLARLAHAAAELAAEGDLDHVPGFVAEMEREYGLVFRALMDVHAATERSSSRGSRGRR
jgi:serine/threonine protein kinase/HPt (histidine-containing phosphotransfer) domain-containing protein